MFSITTVIALVSLALNLKNIEPEMYLLPYIVLCIASVLSLIHIYVETGRKKVGALVGDGVEIGCNSVLNPGTVIGRRTSVYPLTCVRGEIPADCIVKNDMTIVPREE